MSRPISEARAPDNSDMKIISINAGKVSPLFVKDGATIHNIMSGIRKQPVEGQATVQPLGISGDEQADLTVHGGLDKAVYLYPLEHYPFWEAARAQALKQRDALLPGALGENLTTSGLLETELWVGDRLHIGDVIFAVTEPRSPCYKFGALLGFAHAVKKMLQSGYTGVYLKVIQPGQLRAGEDIKLVPGPRELSIAQINDRRLKGRQRDLF